MKLIALLSWYDESPNWLSTAIQSTAGFVDHVVAVDGAYALYDTDTPLSSPEQYTAIQSTCHALGIGFTIHRSDGAWQGNEVEKRTKMFEIGLTVAEPYKDWFVILDADEKWVKVPADLKAKLAETRRDSATAYYDVIGEGKAPVTADPAIHKLFRAIPGLHCDNNHYTYRTGDGKLLWSAHVTPDAEEPTLALDDEFVIEHRTNYRDVARMDAQWAYYRTRDKVGVERGPCQVCEKVQAEHTYWCDWKIRQNPRRLTYGLKEVCGPCRAKLYEANVVELILLHEDPDFILSGRFKQ